ncbi:putative disease resistance protein RGA3 [Corylus avellana]|uniref:putative disease resistance protein RGA3 n=1 Tax=Corylus avellana TaxID=13451 RepID=UPI00286BB07B|nr:putative disease resistance protein RGA3 [Corylus avellana]
MVVGEVFLSAFLQVLFDRLASPELLNFARREGLGKKTDMWRKTLKRIEAVLDHANEKQNVERAVKDRLDDLRDLAYDVEDILDEFATEALRRRLTGGNEATTTKVRNLISCTSTPFMIKYRMESKIQEIDAQFKHLVQQKVELNLGENVRRRFPDTKQRLAPTSLVNEAHVYGREKDKKAVIDMLLLTEKHCDAQVSVIPIIGMGGIGKTSLAQLVYNDEKVQSFFDLKSWVCVSEDFDAVRVTKTVLKSISVSSDDNDPNLLQVKLKERLKGKKFLVVLDDLWNENYQDWTILRAPFEAGAPGSTILITTRNKGVSLKTGTIPAYSLKVLTNDVCLSILAHHALGARDFSGHLKLKDIAKGIVRRCKGSPLAAKVLGGVLRNKVDRDEWEDVLNSKIWDIAEVKSEIAPALMLSYHHLPSHLKRCFGYCSIFPKDYVFKEKQLVLLWMAEGIIQPQEEGKRMEDLGSKYFHAMVSRSFFQQSMEDESLFLMHDLINDLAQCVAGDICFRMEDRIGGSNGRKIPKKARHVSYMGGKYDGTGRFEAFLELKCLRTFLPLMVQDPGYCYLAHNVPLKLLPKLQKLRVFSLSGYRIFDLPESIGDLKHLRFLDLSCTTIKSLPESVTTLYNLQILILENCLFLKKLPSKFGSLVNLRHLNILGANALEGMPPEIGKLTCLQSLSNLVVGKGSCSGVKELGPLLHLRETLCISGLQNVINREDARDARLIEKCNLHGLSLEWSGNLDKSQERTSELEVLNMLEPHKGLKELTIKHYGGADLPTWLRGPSFSNMVLLRIECCEKCRLLPPVGQLPSLKELFIDGMANVKNIGFEFCGEYCSQPFKSLKTLYFKNMKEWENWVPCEEFPKLRKISITRCPKLVGKLPNHLPLLEYIEIKRCRQLVLSISSFLELCKLEIEGSKGVVRRSKIDFNLLCFSSLSTISEFTCKIEGFTKEGLTNVEDLTIEWCKELTPLWSSEVGLLQHLPCLGVLKIRHCIDLISLAAKEVEEQLQLGLPSKLRAIEIRNCKVLESLPQAMMHRNKYLEDIHICECTSLTYFAIGQLPPTLKRLKIEYCNMLILVDGDVINNCGSNTSLEYLEIGCCQSLKYLTSSGELPATLKYLQIFNCNKLESIAKSFHHNSSLEVIDIRSCENLKSLPEGIHSVSNLDQIFINGCPTLVSFSDGGLLSANLRELTISKCEKLQTLPNCIHNLSSLQLLQIQDCSGIVSFPEVGFPTNLTSLFIHYMVSFSEGFFEWGLHRLTSLKQLEIDGGSSHLVSFPEMMLPASLTSLSIKHFPNLKYLSSKGFQFLTSLEKLSIGRCEKLTSFPAEGLPPSLLQLYIIGCPLLKERCKKDQGRESFQIAHIPYVQIDGRFIL